jgi:hypothetical protein
MKSRPSRLIRVSISGPAPGETLSSLLDRAASFWGMDRSEMTAALTHGKGGGDPDAPSPAALHALAMATGFPPHELDEHTTRNVHGLLHWEQRIAYCPRCWAEDVRRGGVPYFRQTWAYCAELACDFHGCLLYAWGKDMHGCRCPLPVPWRSAHLDALWRADLVHAESHKDRRALSTLVVSPEERSRS